MRSTKQRFRYDVFVSYSHYNQDWVYGWFVPQLQTAGLTVCIDRESFTPGSPLVTEMERAVLQSRRTILVLTPEYFSSAWTEFENILLQTLDPSARQRRLIPLILIPCQLPLRLRMLTPIDYSNPTAQAEKISAVIAAIRPQRTAIARRKASTPGTLPLPFEVPTGALPLDSPVYIERSYDDVLRQQITRIGSTTIIEGARQMGKSSLLARALAQARVQQYVTIDFDFQELTEDNLESLESVLRYLAEAFYVRLQLPAAPQEIWQLSLGTKEKLTYFVQRHILQGTPMQVVLVIDEVDRVFGRSYQDDFFGLLRAWHNRRARNPLWKKLNLVLSYSTDPQQAIKNRHQSPFNVGYRLQLRDFSLAEVTELNQRYRRPVRRKDHLLWLVDMLGGHPYLIQQALYALASKAYTLPHLLDTNKMEEGPFTDHLSHYRHLLTSEPDLGQSMQHVLRYGSCPTYEVFVRLRALGLVVGTSQDTVKPRCKLYAAYFVRVLP